MTPTYVKILKAFVCTCFYLVVLTNSYAQEKMGLQLTDDKILDHVDNAKPRILGEGQQLPSFYDLSPLMPPPGNQGQMSSCAGWAVAYALKTSHEKVEKKWEVTKDNKLVHEHVFSPAFIYNQVNHGKDEGSYFSEIFKLLQEKGCATLSTAPYKEGDYLTPPSSLALSEADNYKIAWAKDIDPKEIGTLKSYISHGYPIVIGAVVDKAFQEVKPGEIVRVIGEGGGHAMVVVGYDDKKEGGCFKIMNSWGEDWADKGFCWITYDAFKKHVYEAWLVEDAQDGVVIDAPKDEDNKLYEEDDDDKEEVLEFDDEIEAYIELDSVYFDQVSSEYESYGKGMIFEGYFDIDTEAGTNAQIALYFTKSSDDEVPIACNDSNFMDVNNDLVTYSDQVDLIKWMENDGDYQVFLPNKLIQNLGLKSVLAIPVLFIDGVDVGHGEPMQIDF